MCCVCARCFGRVRVLNVLEVCVCVCVAGGGGVRGLCLRWFGGFVCSICRKCVRGVHVLCLCDV